MTLNCAGWRNAQALPLAGVIRSAANSPCQRAPLRRTPLQGQLRHLVTNLGLQVQAFHCALRLHLHAVQHHAGGDGSALQGQAAGTAAPRQPAAQREAVCGVVVPAQAGTGEVGGNIGRVAAAAELERAAHTAGSAGEQVVQLQGL